MGLNLIRNCSDIVHNIYVILFRVFKLRAFKGNSRFLFTRNSVSNRTKFSQIIYL